MYRKNLKNYSWAKIARKLYLAIYFKWNDNNSHALKQCTKISFQLCALEDFAKNKNSQRTLLLGREFIKSSKPIVFGYNAQLLNTDQEVTLSIPQICLMEIRNAIVMSRAELLIVEKFVLYPSILNIKRDVTPQEEIGLSEIDDSGNLIKLSSSMPIRKIKYAISLIGQCSGNYAHWLTETLPKLALVSNIEKYRDAPIIVDDSVHPNLIESAKIIGGPNRKIYYLSHWHGIEVSCLVYIDPTGYVPVRTRESNCLNAVPFPSPEFFIFSKDALKALRTTVFSNLAINQSISGANRKFFLKRTRSNSSNGRILVNQDDIEEAAKKFGFEIIELENMSFSDQVLLFNKAKIVVGPVGASLCNAVFVPKGGIIVGLAPYYENANGYYFANLMAALEKNFVFLLGKQVNTDGFIVHRDYEISVLDFETLISTILSE
jgi:hypothetical protein